MTVTPSLKENDKMLAPEANTTEGALGSCWGCLSNLDCRDHNVKFDVIAPWFLHLPNHVSQ